MAGTPLHTQSFETVLQRAEAVWDDVRKNPTKHRVLTGERPTGALHLGHYFGSLKARLDLLEHGVETLLVIADYQALTDRDASSAIVSNVEEILLDYLAVGLIPGKLPITIFAHSQIGSLNHLLLPILSLISVSELERNPTVKDEIAKLSGRAVSSLMYTYPAHQAADILFCDGTLVPGGKDQLPHIELTRLVARRFNSKYCENKAPVFVEPQLLPGDAPLLLGVDGKKMGKSDGNAIEIRSSADETARLLRGAKTDSERRIEYAPERRPEVSNLVLLGALCSGQSPEAFAATIGEGGSAALKSSVTDAVNAYFEPIRQERQRLLRDKAIIWDVLAQGIARANEIADRKLAQVHEHMGLCYGRTS